MQRFWAHRQTGSEVIRQRGNWRRHLTLKKIVVLRDRFKVALYECCTVIRISWRSVTWTRRQKSPSFTSLYRRLKSALCDVMDGTRTSAIPLAGVVFVAFQLCGRKLVSAGGCKKRAKCATFQTPKQSWWEKRSRLIPVSGSIWDLWRNQCFFLPLKTFAFIALMFFDT